MIAVAALAGTGVAQAATRAWTLVDVGTLGGPGSHGAAINNNGVVVGCADLPDGGAHAFVYSNGVMRDLGSGTSDGAGSSCALAVNASGTVAGRAASGELVVWAGSSITGLGVSGDVGGIADNGTVVGTSREGGSTFAFKYEGGAVVKLADDPASAATAINARGQVAGTSNGHAFVYADGVVTDLGTLGGSRSSARDINDLGQVVGMASDANAQPQPFLFDGSAMRALPGPGYSGAVAINNQGQVVGSAEGTYGYLLEGATYTRLDTIAAVSAKGWRHLEPTGINDRGWIVGTASTASGDLRAFILIPASERAPVAALARQGRGPGLGSTN